MLAREKLAQERDVNALRRQQLMGELEQQQQTQRKQARVEKTGLFRDRLLRAATPEAAREIVRMQYADPDVGPFISQFSTLDQALAEVPEDPVRFQTYRQQEVLGMGEWMKSQLPKAVGNAIYLPGENRFVTPPAPPKEPAEPSDIATLNRLGLEPTLENIARLRQAQAAPVQPRAPGAPIAVIGPNGRPVYVTPEQAIGQSPARPAAAAGEGGARAKPPVGYRYTATGDLEPIPGGPASPSLPPKEIQKREASFPQAQSAMKGFESKSQSFIADLMALRDHPGLPEITGFAAGRLPGITAQGRAAQALYDKVVAKGGFQALQDMRDASKTGGALGNVSNQEGKQLIASFEAIDRRQDAKDVQAAIDNAISSIQGSQVRMREAFDETYGYRTAREAGAGAGGRQLTPQDREALNWANSNPNDPRAARIKQQLGVK